MCSQLGADRFACRVTPLRSLRCWLCSQAMLNAGRGRVDESPTAGPASQSGGLTSWPKAEVLAEILQDHQTWSGDMLKLLLHSCDIVTLY